MDKTDLETEFNLWADTQADPYGFPVSLVTEVLT